MSKKFDVVIGNPPYQEEAQGEGTRDTPVYHLFMDAAYEVGKKAVLITPHASCSTQGFTPKAWNEKMLADPHLTRAASTFATVRELFPGTDIKRRDRSHLSRRGRTSARRSAHSRHTPSSTRSCTRSGVGNGLHGDLGITSSRSYRYTEKLYEDHPEASAATEGNAALVNTNAFEQFSFLYHDEQPSDGNEYVQVLGVIRNKRVFRWIRSEYITGPESFDKYKVSVPAANESGSTTELLWRRLNNPRWSSQGSRSRRPSSPSVRSTPKPRHRRA